MRMARGDEGAHGLEQALPRVGETHAVLAAHEHAQPQLVFHRIHHLRQPRLGVAQLRRRRGQTARLRRREQGFDLFAFHMTRILFFVYMRISISICYIFIIIYRYEKSKADVIIYSQLGFSQYERSRLTR